MASSVRQTKNLAMSKRSPLAYYLAAKGSTAWELAVKERKEVVADDMPAGWRILDKDVTRDAATSAAKDKKPTGRLFSFWGRRESGNAHSRSSSQSDGKVETSLSPTLSVSEPVDGLRAALSWKPSGQIIVGIRGESLSTAEVVFFERNGLRHGEFHLQFPEDLEKQQIAIGAIELEWNVNSSILAVSLPDCVQLWTMGNYHYYLKQTIHFPESSTRFTRLSWNPEKALRTSMYHSSK